MKLSNKLYDILKDVTTIVLPAISIFYVAMSKIWGWPYPAEISGTIAAAITFLGSLLKISTNKYNAENK